MVVFALQLKGWTKRGDQKMGQLQAELLCSDVVQKCVCPSVLLKTTLQAGWFKKVETCFPSALGHEI